MKDEYEIIPNQQIVSPQLDSLPVINVTGGGLSDEATNGEKALIAANVPIYQRSNRLMRPVIDQVDASDGRKTRIARLINIELHYLIDNLCKSARWQKYDSRQRGYKRINPSKDVANVLLSRIGEWNFSRVSGVITTPTIRPDGSLLMNAGYDPETRLILFEPPQMPIIPDTPTKDDALKALELLESVFTEFPFKNDMDRSVALSAVLTVVARGLFNVSPMHAVTAPTAGSGKSFLLDVVAAIGIGQICPVIAAGRSEEETEKRLGSALLAGQQIISIDNFNGDLSGDALCQVIERPIVNIRILGKSKLVTIESRSTIFATGNNLRLVGDMTRRAILCTLDAEQERPESRQFNNNPVDIIFANRGKFIAAALTIERAYIVAGKPNKAPRLASFEKWSDNVRSALIWLGRADPVDSMINMREEDPSLQAMVTVFTEIRSVIGCNNPHTAAEILTLALKKDGEGELAKYQNPMLREALMNASGGKSGHITSRELGKWLGRHKGRIVQGLRLEGKSDEHGHAGTWWLKAVEADERG